MEPKKVPNNVTITPVTKENETSKIPKPIPIKDGKVIEHVMKFEDIAESEEVKADKKKKETKTVKTVKKGSRVSATAQLLAKLDAKMDTQIKETAEIKTGITEIENKVDKRFNQFEHKMETRFDKIEKRVNEKIEGIQNAVKNNADEIQNMREMLEEKTGGLKK